ncbi:basic salivary proline-rich protein 2-like [Cervus canadensis]|uniref:basic salivary proline-rich protein 2-like n=1 Tax=Cervus canadensis TaxID=1574408 RepID=UPI001CA309BF|nr:basic salivary proline-rich protein 2-like [Cervus canadensis]
MVGVRGESQRTQHHGCPPPREERRVGQTEHRFPSLGGHGRHGGYREGRHLHLLCPQLSPSSSSTPRGHPGGATPTDCGPGRGARLSAGAGQAAQGVEPAGPAGGLPRGGSGLPAPRPARPGGGGNAGASSPRPAARPHTPPAAGSHPARRPAAPRHERRRWLQAESLPPRPPLAPVRRHYSLFAASGGDGVGLGRRLHLYRGPSCEGKAPSAGVRRLPVPPPSPRLSPAPASSSCSSYRWYKLLRHCFRSRPGSRWSFILSPTRPGHRQQQPPPTEDSQPGSQPAPPSAECAAAAHGNSRAQSGGARAAPPSALKAEVAEDLRVPSGAAEGFLRERESGGGLGPGGGEVGSYKHPRCSGRVSTV